jgi:hypothetical protein
VRATSLNLPLYKCSPDMSAPRTAILATVYVPFVHSMLAVECLSPPNMAHLIQRGVAAILHSFVMAYLCTAHVETALASARATADRFQQFVCQATAEKMDTSLLSEAFTFALRGTTYSRVLDDLPTLTKRQQLMLRKVHTEYQTFVDQLHTISQQPDFATQNIVPGPILAAAAQAGGL